jgi:tellurite resistance protein TehA-like permease
VRNHTTLSRRLRLLTAHPRRLIVASSTGAIVSGPMVGHHETLATLSAGFSFLMVLIGLSLALMVITIYLLRLIIHGPPDVSLILSAFVILGPLGQGGYSLLANGANLALLLPAGRTQNAPSGELVYAVAFCAAFVLWAMGLCWALLAFLAVGNQVLRQGRIPFNVGYWGMIFPNGVYALLSCQLAKVLDSEFFRGYAAFWCGAFFGPFSLVFQR